MAHIWYRLKQPARRCGFAVDQPVHVGDADQLLGPPQRPSVEGAPPGRRRLRPGRALGGSLLDPQREAGGSVAVWAEDTLQRGSVMGGARGVPPGRPAVWEATERGEDGAEKEGEGGKEGGQEGGGKGIEKGQL